MRRRYPYNVRRCKQLLRFWREICALSLTVTYSTLFLFAALCLATGVFHPETHHDHERSSHPHTDADSHHASVLLDICDFAWQTLTASARHTETLPSAALSLSETVKPSNFPFCSTEYDISPSIRAPPDTHS